MDNMEDISEFFSIDNLNCEDDFPNFGLEFEFDMEEDPAVNEQNEVPVVCTEKPILNDNDVDEFIDEKRNKNTVRKTRTDLNKWKRWCSSIGEKRAMEDIPPDQLDSLLSHFFIKVRKLDNTKFEPSTLTLFQRSFDHHLRQHREPYFSLLTDKEFGNSRESLESKRKQLRLEGKGRRPNKGLELNKDEMEKLWSEKHLGDHSPDALIRTVWINNTMHFGWRARDEHRKARFGDFELRREEGNGRQEYVIRITKRGSKTRSGGQESVPERYFDPRIYATGNNRCPVKIFKSYLARRPAGMMNDEDPFYLALNKNPTSTIWYKKQPLGVHSLGNFMKTMAQAVQLPCKRVNHSARRTMITTFRHENVNPLDISQLSGHNNIKSIDSYSSVSEEQQKQMSLKIANRCSGREPLKAKPVNEITASAMVNSTMAASTSNLAASTSFAGAVFNQCTIVVGPSKSPLPPKSRRFIIHSDDESD